MLSHEKIPMGRRLINNLEIEITIWLFNIAMV